MIKQSRKLRPLPVASITDNSGVLTAVPIKTVLESVEKLIHLVKTVTQSELSYSRAIEIKSELDYKQWEREETARKTGKEVKKLKLAEEGRLVGLKYNDVFPKELRQKDRTNRLIRFEIVGKLKSWDKSYKTLPSAGASINLGAVDSQLARVTKQGNQFVLEFTPWDTTYYIVFNIPKGLKNKDIALPILNINEKTGKLEWNFVFEERLAKPPISSDYVIGVDRGITEFATWSVVDTRTEETVAIGKSSDQVQHIIGKIKRIERETRGISRKIDGFIKSGDIPSYNKYRSQLLGKLAKITELKDKIAQLVAQEIVSTSQLYGNTIIALEDLSWAGNWNSRVPFGLLKQRVSELAERLGTHVQLVNPADTSQSCSECGAVRERVFRGRTFVCKSCKLEIDRDVNAAINIAKRGLESAVKSGKTRDKTKKTPKRAKLRHKKASKLLLQFFKGTAGVQHHTDSVTSGDLDMLDHISTTSTNQTQKIYYYRL